MSTQLASKRSFLAGLAILGATLLLAASPLRAAAGTVPAGFADRYAQVNGVRLHYLIGGTGSPVASDVKGVVIPGSGHWLMEEAPQTVIPAIIEFLN